jgi:hypothetical protein
MSTETTTKIGKPIKRRDPDPDEKDLEPVGSTQLKRHKEDSSEAASSGSTQPVVIVQTQSS